MHDVIGIDILHVLSHSKFAEESAENKEASLIMSCAPLFYIHCWEQKTRAHVQALTQMLAAGKLS